MHAKGGAFPALPIAEPVTVQLRNSNGVCWGATYRAAGKSGSTSRLQLRDTASEEAGP